MPHSQPNQHDDANRPQEPALLGRELGGDLPCFACGYNLRGLSVRSMCPECGTLVRATILSLVDPMASELQPISTPRALGAGLVLWAGGAVMAALIAWLPHIADVLRGWGVPMSRPSAALGVTLGVAVSGLGSLAMIRPHAKLPWWHIAMAALATVMYIPLTIEVWRYHVIADSPGGPRYLSGWSPSNAATEALVISCLLIGGIILCLRPMARALVARSLLLRTGRVDRQTMYAMAIAAGIMAAGAALGWLAKSPTPMVGETARIIGIVLIAFGSLLLTIGTLGSLLDAARIAQSVISPRVTLKQVIREGRPGPKSKIGRMLEQSPRQGDKS